MACQYCINEVVEPTKKVDNYRTNALEEKPQVIESAPPRFVKTKETFIHIGTLILFISSIASVLFTATMFVTYVGHLSHFLLFHDLKYSWLGSAPAYRPPFEGWMFGVVTLLIMPFGLSLIISCFFIIYDISKSLRKNLTNNVSDIIDRW